MYHKILNKINLELIKIDYPLLYLIYIFFHFLVHKCSYGYDVIFIRLEWSSVTNYMYCICFLFLFIVSPFCMTPSCAFNMYLLVQILDRIMSPTQHLLHTFWWLNLVLCMLTAPCYTWFDSMIVCINEGRGS